MRRLHGRPTISIPCASNMCTSISSVISWPPARDQPGRKGGADAPDQLPPLPGQSGTIERGLQRGGGSVPVRRPENEGVGGDHCLDTGLVGRVQHDLDVGNAGGTLTDCLGETSNRRTRLAVIDDVDMDRHCRCD